MNKLGDLLTQSQGSANVNLGLLNIHVSSVSQAKRAINTMLHVPDSRFLVFQFIRWHTHSWACR